MGQPAIAVIFSRGPQASADQGVSLKTVPHPWLLQALG
jgi:hypothetical protein